MLGKEHEVKDVPNLQVFDASEFLTSSNRHDYLGHGGFAAVRKCKHPKLKSVVVKCFTVTGTSHQCEKVINEISREAKAISHLDHKNIVKVYGLTAWQQGIYQGIVMEFMEGGNLSSLIFMKVVKNIPWKLRLRFCLEIAEGLEYLHYNGRSTVFIHGDLKPSNILLTADLEIKIADFGAVTIAQATGASHASIELESTKQHTLLYAAPEFLRKPTSERTREMDVYSIAMIFYEILTRQRAFQGVSPKLFLKKLLSRDGLKPDEILLLSTRVKMRNAVNDLHIFNLLETIMKKCWDMDPAKRLSVRQVCDLLSNEKESLNDLKGLIEDIKLQMKHTTVQTQHNKLRNNYLNEFSPPFTSCYLPTTDISKHTTVLASPAEETIVNEEGIFAHGDESYTPLLAGALSHTSQTMKPSSTNAKPQILIVGSKNVGKSCIIRRYLKHDFRKLPSTPGLTCGKGTVTTDESKEMSILLWDLGGDFRMLLSAVCQYSLCAVVYAYDVTNNASFDDVSSWLEAVNKHRKGPITQMLIGNKCDQEHERKVSSVKGKHYAESNSMLFHETSAKDDTNIETAFDDLLATVKKQEMENNANPNSRAVRVEPINRRRQLPQDERQTCGC